MASAASLTLASASSPALRGSIDEAVAEVVVQEPERDRLQGLRGRRDLGQDVGPVS